MESTIRRRGEATVIDVWKCEMCKRSDRGFYFHSKGPPRQKNVQLIANWFIVPSILETLSPIQVQFNTHIVEGLVRINYDILLYHGGCCELLGLRSPKSEVPPLLKVLTRSILTDDGLNIGRVLLYRTVDDAVDCTWIDRTIRSDLASPRSSPRCPSFGNGENGRNMHLAERALLL